MPNEDPNYAKWFNRSLKLLTFRPRSVREITEYLQRKKVASSLISEIVTRLLERKLLDDLAFAEWFVENRVSFRPRSARILSGELAQKGIARDIIDQALESHMGKDQELAGAIKLAEKKLRTLKFLPEKAKVLKIKAFLWQKGYSREIAEKALKTVVWPKKVNN